MKKPNKRLYFFINGLLQIVDCITYIFMSPFNKVGTHFCFEHIMYYSKKQLEKRMKESEKLKK